LLAVLAQQQLQYCSYASPAAFIAAVDVIRLPQQHLLQL